MECNKDEGVRAKEIAERKFNENDIMGAKKFALKAQSLYPGLDGIQKLLVTLDVYICAENKVGGEADWYSILGVSPEVDNEIVKKQYKMLALSLHPDRNKSVGAGGAFNLLKNAWDLLSNKAKRAAYDRRRNVVHQNVSTTNRATKGANGSVHQKVSTAQSSQRANDSDHQKVRTGAQGSHEANGSTTKGRGSNAKAQTGTKRPAPSTGPACVKPIPTSFWSNCPKCRVRFEYARRHLMSNVFCVDCNKLFQLVEMVPPAATCGSNSKTPFCAGSTPASENVGETDFISHVSFTKKSVHWTPFSRAAGASQASRVDLQASAEVAGASQAVKAARVDLQASGRNAGSSKRGKDFSEDKRASKKGRKCEFDEETLERARESIRRDLNDNERKKRFDARSKKNPEASQKKDDDLGEL